MRLTLRQLQIFIAVAEHGSTVAAASAVSLSQSAISNGISEIERLLGAPFFDRVGSRLLLNADGREFLQRSRELLGQAETLERRFSAGGTAQATPLRLAASSTIGKYVLPQMLSKYRDLLGRSGEEVIDRSTVLIGNTRQVLDAVLHCEVDIGFVDGLSHERDLRMLEWLQDELVVVAAPFHPIARRVAAGASPVEELRTATWLMREPGSGTRAAVEQALAPYLGHLTVGIELGDSEAIKYAVSEGLGLGCLSRWVVGDLLDNGKLVQIRTSWPELERRFSVAFHKDRTPSAGLQRFITYCQTPAVRLIVPYPAGGGSDEVARVLSMSLTRGLGRPTVVENRPGEGGALAAELVAKAEPDGLTLLLMDVSHAMGASLHARRAFVPLADFTPIAQVANGANLLVIGPSVPATTVSEFVSHARSSKGMLLYGSAGMGSSPHIAAELLLSALNLKMKHVTYEGLASATSDLIAGRIDMMIGGVTAVLPHVRAGTLRALAVTSAARLSSLPEVPTLDEIGVKGFDLKTWFGIAAPKGAPAHIVTWLNSAITRALQSEDVRQRFLSCGVEAANSSADRFGALLESEILKWRKVVEAVES
jgi:tripartite-type tricarboxylate transporter receptor subunit TctC/DNA-binding transcriptional LysR family regulator